MSAAVSGPLVSTNGSVAESAEQTDSQLATSLASSERGTREPVTEAGPSKGSKRNGGIFRPRSGLFKKRSDLSEDDRRDSGMAPSLSTAGDHSEIMDSSSSPVGGYTAPSSSAGAPVPSITINDERGTDSEPRQAVNNTLSPTQIPTNQPTSAPPTDESFAGLTTSIPRGSLDDPFSSQLQFSNRGSVLLSGFEADAFARTLPKTGSVRSTFSGRRPLSSVEAYSASQRSISADDRRLSRRVRSYYEPSTEVVAEESDHLLTTTTSNLDAKGEEQDTLTELQGSMTTQVQPSRANKRASLRMEANEAAGGIEDWTDVDSRDVDRFGFIKARSTSSKRSSLASAQLPNGLDARPASRQGTPLSRVDEAQGNQQKGVGQGKRNRLSLTPGAKTLRPSPSLLSSRSKASRASRASTSSRNPFRSSKTQPRWLLNAPEMLMPPPGFGQDAMEPDQNPARESRRADKWQKMARPISDPLSRKGAGTKYSFPTFDPKLISRVWKGIPDRWRSEAWFSFLSSSAARRSTSSNPQPSEEDLEKFFFDCQENDCADDMQIDMDVPRTIGNHLQFRKRYHGGQRFLFRVLRALSMYFPDTGYVQGMASVVSTLLVYYEEARAFVMAVRLWELRGVGALYTEGFEGLMSALKQLEDRWIQNTEVAVQLESLGINSSAWGPKWYLTVFNYVLPFHTMLRVWDVFILLSDAPSFSDQGRGGKKDSTPDFDVLHAVTAAILSALRDTIVDAEFENAMKALTSPVQVGKDDKLMNIAKRLYEQKRGKR